MQGILYFFFYPLQFQPSMILTIELLVGPICRVLSLAFSTKSSICDRAHSPSLCVSSSLRSTVVAGLTQTILRLCLPLTAGIDFPGLDLSMFTRENVYHFPDATASVALCAAFSSELGKSQTALERRTKALIVNNSYEQHWDPKGREATRALAFDTPSLNVIPKVLAGRTSLRSCPLKTSMPSSVKGDHY